MQVVDGERGGLERAGAPRAAGPARSGWQPLVELCGVTSAAALLVVLGRRVVVALAETGEWWIAPVALAIGLIAADFASGVVHWFGDSFFREDSPIVGAMLIAPFREHHRDPDGITHHGLLELHGNSCLPVVGAVGAALAVAPDLESTQTPIRGAYAVLFWFALAAVATNQCHVWAHRADPPRFARALQRVGLILSPEGHRRHHSGSFRTSYCITTGWLNPWLDRVGFFPRLEDRIRAALRRPIP